MKIRPGCRGTQQLNNLRKKGGIRYEHWIMGGGNAGPGCGGDEPLLPVLESMRKKIPARANSSA
jgi:hypothetical protein